MDTSHLGSSSSLDRRSFMGQGATATAALLLRSRTLSLGKDSPLAERQPFTAQTRRVIAALDQLGAPLKPIDLQSLEHSLQLSDDAEAVAGAMRVLDAYTLGHVSINPEGRVSVSRGIPSPQLVEQGWRVFLIKVINQGAVTAALRVQSPQSLPTSSHEPGFPNNAIVPRTTSRPPIDHVISARDTAERWLEIATFDEPPLMPSLSGLGLEYRILQVYARERGKREATLVFATGNGTTDLGGRNELPILFQCSPAVSVVLSVKDADGEPTMASFLVRDAVGRIYPARSKRLAPDFPFQQQVYRADGEQLVLPAGEFTVEVGRGPEYIFMKRELTVDPIMRQAPTFQLVRWIDPAADGWYSGDHHIHAAGCKHYSTPTEGVKPEVIARHIRGEGLRFGAVLDWGPSWYYQKQFFSGHVDQHSTRDALMRYDVEVSGFPSSHCGHLVLIGMREMDYPNTREIEQWPTWNIPILKWAKNQGAVVGYAHSGVGLNVSTIDLPNLEIPPFNECGANEYLVDVTHEINGEPAIDIFSTVDTCAPAELNLWYHALNCGFRTPIGGETDFPCAYETLGVGRSYVQLDTEPKGDEGYRAWIEGLKAGRAYVSDGRSHLMDFRVNETMVGKYGSELKLAAPPTVQVSARVAAWLEPRPTPDTDQIRCRPLSAKPYWHTERARVGSTRNVSVELIVNGNPVAQETVTADGVLRSTRFEVPIARSSWMALRIYPAAHTNPIFVTVGGKPLRASKASAEWCLRCVDKSWEQQSPRISPVDRAEAADAYERARRTYRQRKAECEAE
jgi:hypothetical protein